MFLSDVLIQRARAHTSRKRSFLLHAFLHGMVKKIVSHMMIIREIWYPK
jgi:hypothetical protein